MQTRAPSFGAILAMVAFALSSFLLTLFAWISFGGPVPFAAEGYRFTALYREAVQVPEQADVRISGVGVGKVTAVEQTGPNTRLEIEMDSEFAPIPSDTRTVVRRKTLLGEAYVELSPGTPIAKGGEPLEDGGELRLSASVSAVEFDEVLRAFDPPTRASLQQVLEELALATGSYGAEINGALGNLPFAVSDTAALVRILGSQRDDVRTLVRDSGTVLEALSERPGALAALVRNGARVVEATAARDAALTETVRIMPTFLDELRPTLELARDVGAEAAPLLDELQPAAEELPATLRDLSASAPDVEAVFRTLPPLQRRARVALPATTRLLEATRPLVRKLHPALRDLVPVVDWLALYRREFTAWMPKLAAVAASANESGHFARILIVLASEGLTIFDQRPPGNRHNPYPKPGSLAKVGSPHLLAFDCANAAPESDAPPCVEQGPFRFRGYQGTFPQVRQAP
jgi:phospholipid/cholesterol/gamma-HCH transport system substrate-binding protein